MQSSGAAEGLRGLLDSSLLKSSKKIMQNRAIFGPSALALGGFIVLSLTSYPDASCPAINVMAIFIHNEPTCLGVIQENGLPESFYRVVESGLEPAFEVCGLVYRFTMSL